MKPKYLFSILTVLIAALTITAILYSNPALQWWSAGGGISALIILFFLYRSVVKPVIAAQRGLELLSSQDFNNRLVKVNEPGADKIVQLFNDLITRLKNERLRLREQDTFLRLLIDASPMGVVMLNLDYGISMVNNAFLKVAELPTSVKLNGKKIKDIDSSICKALYSLNPGDCKIIRRDGSRSYRCYHLWFMQEGFRRHFYLIESLTEELRLAEKDAYEKVIRMISHEVNNTMGSVESILETLSDETTYDKDLHDTVESCRERCEKMCGFIDSFAELARIPEPDLRLVNIDDEISRMLPFLNLMAYEGIKISFNHDLIEKNDEKDVKVIKADMSLLQQAIVNIVKNAIESIVHTDMENSACPEEMHSQAGEIIISTTKKHERVTLVIANNGHPISDDTERHLFSPFFSTKRSGRGLGLTLISEILRKHGCSFSLRTDTDSITRFSISFPAKI